MNTVLIVSPEQIFFKLFLSDFGHMNISFFWMKDIDQALQSCSIEKPGFLFLVHENQSTLQKWTEQCASDGQAVPFVCFTKQTGSDERQKLWDNGAADVFSLPLNRRELEHFLRSFTAKLTRKTAQIKGNLADFSVTDLIKTFESRSAGGRISLENGSRKGGIEFYRGKIMNANYEWFEPLEAVTIMAGWFNGRFELNFDSRKRQRRIMLENEQVLMECRESIDSCKQLSASLPMNRKVYVLPGLNFEHVNPKDRPVLIEFINGYGLKRFVDGYTGNPYQLLKKFQSWIEKGWLVGNEEFEKGVKKFMEWENRSGIRKTLDKVFNPNASQYSDLKKENRKNNKSAADFRKTKTKALDYEFDNRDRLTSFLELLEKNQ